ncbi:MAG: hypothetical protein ACRD2I_21705, partial [Vicinamibacterales bacterium]
MRRLRIGLWICLAVYFLFALYVVGAPEATPGVAWQVAWLRLACAAAFGAGLAALRLAVVRQHALAMGLGAICLVALSSSLSGVLIPQDNVLVPISFVVLSMFTAALVPWGWRTQAAIVAVQIGALALNAWLLEAGASALLQPTMFLTLVAFGISILVAREFTN